MIAQRIAASLLAAGTCASISGCYVVPIDPRYPPVPGQPVAINQNGGFPVARAATGPVPTILQARLYPLNESAGKMGPLTATVADTDDGHATFSVAQGSELLQGEASRVAPDYPGFGLVHREVYGNGRMPSGQRGIASATGARGTYVNCEYVLADAHRGTGACLFSNGAKYQLHFGI